MNKLHNTTNTGFALLLAIIIASIALSIGLSMLHITLKQLALGTTTKGSEVAFQVASAGMECLRYVRNNQSDEMYAGSSVQVDCLGGSSVISNSGSNSQHRIYRDETIDWAITGSDTLCVDTETHLLIADGGNDITYTFPGGSSKTCNSGDVCTFGFVRGYNRSCSDIGNNSVFTVQRELTVEF
jgi:hypothetical protein